jgi:CheY-like chemotaxis protein
MSLRILIVDDDLDDLELLDEAILEAQPNSNIDKATGGRAAISFLDSYPDSALPHLVILDYNMPDISGSDVLAYIKEQKRYDKIPRVVFSTSDAERHISESLKSGATKYLVKPKTKRELDELALQMLSLISAE